MNTIPAPPQDRPAEPPPQRCARHPDTETFLRCGRCDTPICAKCAVQTPVGARCRACSGVKRIALLVKPAELARAAAVGLAAAAVGSALLEFVQQLIRINFSLIGPLAVGFLTGWATSNAAHGKRARELGVTAIVIFVVGWFLGPLVLQFALVGGVPLGLVPRLILSSLFNLYVLVGLAIGALLAWMRAR